MAFYMWPSQWGGGTTYVVVRGTSMQPNFYTGDIVIAREADEYEVGDVVVYAVPEQYNGAGKLIMHRLKSIEPNGRFIIQGDNRDSPDDFDVDKDDVVGVERFHIPKVGLLTQILGKWWFLAGLVALFALLKLWPEDEEDTDETAAVLPSLETERPADPEGRRRSDRRRSPDRRGADELESVPPLVPEVAPVEEEPARVPAAPRRAQVIVDGDGLATAGWPDVHLDFSRQLAVEAADEIGKRFGTQVALVFEAAVDGVEDRGNAHVERPTDDQSVVELVHQRVSERGAGLTMLVVTDQLDVADQVWAAGGSAMRCTAWLALGQQAGVPVP